MLSPDSVDSALTLATDFGFGENCNHSLKVEEKKNQQNRIVAQREPPALPPRKGLYTPSGASVAPPKDRPPPMQIGTPVRQE